MLQSKKVGGAMRNRRVGMIVFGLLVSVLISVDGVWAINPPPTPTDEQKAEWQRMGEENQRKYGAAPDPNKLDRLSGETEVEVYVESSPSASLSATPEVAERHPLVVVDDVNIGPELSPIMPLRLWYAIKSWLAGLFGK